MLPQVCYYDPAERQNAKERHRASDAALLQDGVLSRDDLRNNGFFSSLMILGASVVCQEEFA